MASITVLLRIASIVYRAYIAARTGAIEFHRYAAFLLLTGAFLSAPLRTEAVPSFARQTNLQCMVCHAEFPLLTSFGHDFKMGGYTMSAEQTDLPPLAIMLMPSFTHTSKGQDGGAAPSFKDNNNFALTQASIFYSGRFFGPYASKLFGEDAAKIANKLGIFFQTTYDGIGKTWSWDNAELRFANTGKVGNADVTYGFYANNNPTLQDPWNTTPAWGFPFSGSGLAPGPNAATLIDGALAQQVVGAGGYAMVSHSFYIDIAGYRTLGAGFQRSVGVDPTDETQVTGLAPYWRLAWERPVGANGRWEIGTFGLAARTFPGRDASMGKDRITDYGIDSEYQTSIARSDFTGLLSWTYEKQNWNASEALGSARNSSDHLSNLKATADYLYDKTYGGAIQYFVVNGTNDDLLYADSVGGSPKSDGFVFQFNYMPMNKGTGPDFWPRSNIKLSIQYTLYNHFNGGRSNIDGAGRNASDNNTTYIEAWIVF